MLILVGTYSEKLGHVSGKGSGLYVLDVDDETLKVRDDSSTIETKAQLGPDTSTAGGHAGMRNPTYLIAHDDGNNSDDKKVQIYVVDERGDGPGSLRALTLDKSTGKLSPLGSPLGIQPAMEAAACCHVMVTPDGEYVMAANYLCGSIVAVGRNKTDGSLIEDDVNYCSLPPHDDVDITYPGPNAARQEGSHAHMVVYSGGTKSATILVPDLGSDVIWSMPYLGRLGAGEGPIGKPLATGRDAALAGGGPRHVVLHPDPKVHKAYVAYELTSLVACFDLDVETGAIKCGDGERRPEVRNVMSGLRCNALFAECEEQQSSTDNSDARMYDHLLHDDGGRNAVPVCSDAETSVAAIRLSPDASHVVVSSRIVGAEGAISALPLTEDGCFVPGARTKIRGTIGRGVRDFVVVGGGGSGDDAAPVVIAANQDTDEIVVLRDGKEVEILTKDALTPVCLCVVPN